MKFYLFIKILCDYLRRRRPVRLRCVLRTLRVLFDLRDLRADLRALRLVLRRRRFPPPTKLSTKAPPDEHPQPPIFFYKR